MIFKYELADIEHICKYTNILIDFETDNLLGKECLVPLFFCYSRFGDKEKQRIELEKYKMNAAKLLNAYERYKHPEIQRNTVVTKLKTQQRLHFKEIK